MVGRNIVHISTPVTPVEEKPLVPQVKSKKRSSKVLAFLKSQLSLRNLFLLLLTLFLTVIAVAVWGLSYAGSTLAINSLMDKLRSSAAEAALSSISNLFDVSMSITASEQQFFWSDKNELQSIAYSDKVLIRFNYI
jgi:hypothetical protein